MSVFELAELMGNFGEFFGAIAVVITLVYLAHQIKQTSRIGYWQMYTTATATIAQYQSSIAGDLDLQRLWSLITSVSPGEVSDEELSRCRSLFEGWLIGPENVFLINRQFGKPTSTRGDDEEFAWIGRCPLAKKIWLQVREDFDPLLREQIDKNALLDPTEKNVS